MRLNAWVGWLAGGSLAAVAACVLSSPPSDLPIPAPTRPAIVDVSATPPLDQPVTALPQSFAIFVEAEPDKPLYWNVWRDYGGDQQLLTPGSVAAGTDRRTIDFEVNDIQFPNQCHKIWLFVGYDLLNVEAIFAGNEGDLAVWRYEPGGQYGGCPIFDGGVPDASVPDTSDGAVD